MLESNIEDTSKQTCGRETEPTARGMGKNDKSRDAIANMEARLAKVKLAMVDTREEVDLIEQSMEKGLEDLREQIQDLLEGMLVSQFQLVLLCQHGSWPQEASKVKVSKPQGFNGKRDAKELENFLWHMERRSVQDLATAMAVIESLMDYKRGDSSQVESLEDSHATGGGDEVSRDHNAPIMGFGKMPNIREGRDEAHMGSMMLLGALQVNPKPSMPKTFLLLGVQVKEAKEECLEKVLETHREVSKRGNNGDVDGIGGEKCHKMLQMTLPMGLYRRWEASRDPWRHLHLATKWKSMEASREG
ncbi:hypothetical protein AAG906_019653 [Vitis piasezkii]